MVKKIISMLILLIMFTGCAEHGNVSTKAYLRVIMVDGNKLTFVFYSDEQEARTVTAENPSEAKKLAELSAGMEIFTGHTELVILNNCNSLEILEYMLHEWKLSPSCMVATSDSENVLADAENLAGSIRIAQQQEIAPQCDIITILAQLLESGIADTVAVSGNGLVQGSELKSVRHGN